MSNLITIPQKNIDMYMLDRNAVIIIGKSVNNKITKGDKNYSHVCQLKKIDKRNNIISVFASTLEGINPYKDEITNREKQLNDGIIAVDNFFKFARTDSKIILPIAKILASENFFQSFEPGRKFLCEISPDMYNKISYNNLSQLDKIQEKIFNIAEQLNISPSHPVVICTISALYGNEKSLHMLKLHKKNYDNSLSYNAMSDITFIQFITVVNFSEYNKKIRAIPFSFDDDLMHIYNIFKECNFIVHNYHYCGQHVANFLLSPPPQNFFPKATENQYKSIITKICSN